MKIKLSELQDLTRRAILCYGYTEKATEHGFGIVGTNNTSTSSGAGYFAKKIPKANLIGFVFASRMVDFWYSGNSTTNPSKALEGAIRAFGEHKGARLAMVVQILGGALVNFYFPGKNEREDSWGHLTFAIDPELLTDPDSFRKDVSLMIKKVKETRKLPDVEEVFVPGEYGNRLSQQHLESGEIEIEDNLLEELKKVIS